MANLPCPIISKGKKMSNYGKQRIELEKISGASGRAIADSRYETIIRTSGDWFSFTDGREWHPGQPYIEKISKVLIQPWEKRKADKREWHETYLDTCEQLSPGVWRVVIIEPSTD